MFRCSYAVVLSILIASSLFSMELEDIQLERESQEKEVIPVVLIQGIAPQSIAMGEDLPSQSTSQWKYQLFPDSYSNDGCRCARFSFLVGVGGTATFSGSLIKTVSCLWCESWFPTDCSLYEKTPACSELLSSILFITGLTAAGCSYAPCWKEREDGKCPWIKCNLIKRTMVEESNN